MSVWFKKNLPIFIIMGIIAVLLALFLLPAYARTNYEIVQGTTEGNKNVSLINTLTEMPNYISDVGQNLKISFGEGKTYYEEAFPIFSTLWVALFIYVLIKNKSGGEYKNIEHGSGDWCKNGEQYSVLNKKEGFALAVDNYLPVIPNPPLAKNGNILVIGGSGSGKSASFAIPNVLQMLGSYICTDPKGELYDKTAGILKKYGYEIHVFNLADPKYSDGYNPLTHIRNSTDVDIIAKIISKKDDKGGGNKGDPFWDQTSEALLKSLIYYILLHRPPEEHSLASCLALVRLGGDNEGQDLMDIFMQLDREDPARRSFETIRLGSEKTFANILVSLAAKLEAFDSEEIAAVTSTNSIEFEELAQKKSAVFFITPESHSTYDFLMNIFFSQLFQRLYEFGDKNGGSLPIPMFLILDEFANIGRIPNFERVLSTCRSKKLHISIILQSIDQLMEIYDEKVTENIMANCSTHLFLGSNAQKTLETFSKQLGEKTIKRDSSTRNTDKNSNISGHSYSDQIMARALMTPDELRRMKNTECIILIQGMKPIKAVKQLWFKMHPRRKEAVECEISHISTENIKRGEYTITDPRKIVNSELHGPLFEDTFEKNKNTTTTSNTTSSVEEITPKSTNIELEENIFNTNNRYQSQEEYDFQEQLEKKFEELFETKKKKNTYVE